jgi:hypothetical protein
MTVLAFPVRRMISAVPWPYGQQDDLGPPDMLLRTVPIGDNRLQLGSVGGAQFDLGSFVHSPDSHDRVRRGILRRIEMSIWPTAAQLCSTPSAPFRLSIIRARLGVSIPMRRADREADQ